MGSHCDHYNRPFPNAGPCQNSGTIAPTPSWGMYTTTTKKLICTKIVCPTDMCWNGEPRQPIGDKCCGCPEACPSTQPDGGPCTTEGMSCDYNPHTCPDGSTFNTTFATCSGGSWQVADAKIDCPK